MRDRADIARLEGQLSNREADLARFEALLSRREADIARIEAANANREADERAKIEDELKRLSTRLK